MPDTPLAGTSILVVEDDALLRRQITAFLERAGAEVTAVGDLASARQALDSLVFELALADVNLPDGLGTDLLRDGVFSANTGVVVMTGEGGVKGAVEAMRLGALDYLPKPFEMAELGLVFGRVRQRRQARRLEEHRREDATPRDDEFVFGSALAGLQEQIERILTSDRRMSGGLAPVLIQGETGTGKTTIARWLHHRGPRSEEPLVEVNCSALPETLAESELFGHERGAFTDARTARLGLFEAANGGTLFLDELASLSQATQAKVLVAIEDRRIRRVGGNRPIAVDARVIAASNRDLRELVGRGEFRSDLLHRLDLFRLQIPPLRERRQDILPLVEALMKRICRRHRLEPRGISESGRARLLAYPWPGNVRELSHELERALVFEDGELQFLQLAVTDRGTVMAPLSPTAMAAEEWLNPAFEFPGQGFSLEEAIDRLVKKAVDQADGNVSAAARLLGVTRDVVRYRLEGKPARRGEKLPT
ncbi:MAG: sigma-54-dependent Fis family transcriptional regulator [Verrucomicrobiales bacterium]|nr:sigma-54-dependent Fis family transcriptional regulator [Verrucomicrobiales bacterium]